MQINYLFYVHDDNNSKNINMCVESMSFYVHSIGTRVLLPYEIWTVCHSRALNFNGTNKINESRDTISYM